ncbi:MAG TPA: hypothetical protein VJP85_05665 [Candidatus Baltobacteraceae bacterium]|nr:hypothetical protein [Candidatus Baltobacteraceae bacterium]
MMRDADLEAMCLNPDDLARVAEFFDCDVDAAFEFVRKIWLPDATQTSARIAGAIADRDWTSVLYLCDKLREGARCVGATQIMRYATQIERATKNQKWCWLQNNAKDLRAALETLASLLLDCLDLPPGDAYVTY